MCFWIRYLISLNVMPRILNVSFHFRIVFNNVVFVIFVRFYYYYFFLFVFFISYVIIFSIFNSWFMPKFVVFWNIVHNCLCFACPIDLCSFLFQARIRVWRGGSNLDYLRCYWTITAAQNSFCFEAFKPLSRLQLATSLLPFIQAIL